jgi:hypothetical protein
VARIVQGTGVVFPELKQIAKKLQQFDKQARRKYMKAAFNAAAKVGVDKLKQVAPRGPTGNLKRNVIRKATAGYGLAGYRYNKRPVPGDASHQGLVEFGTKPRRTKKGRFASTFATTTKGRGGSGMQVVIPKRGKNAGRLKTTSPAYPKSFFKAAPLKKKVDLKRMPVGGRLGSPPIKKAFELAAGPMRTVLRKQMETVIERASSDLAKNFRVRQ